MFCKMCAKEVEVNASFCPYCGYKLKLSQSVTDDDMLSENEALSHINKGSVFYEKTNSAQQLRDNPVYGYPQTDKECGGQASSRLVQQSGAAISVNTDMKKSVASTVIITAVVTVIVMCIIFGFFQLEAEGKLFGKGISERGGTENSEGLETTTSFYIPDREIFTPDTLVVDLECYANIGIVTVYKGPDTSVYKAICNVLKDESLIVKGFHTDYPEWFFVYSAKTNDYGWVYAALVSEKKSTENVTQSVNTNTEVRYYDVAARFDVAINVGEGYSLNLRRQPEVDHTDNIILQIPDKAKVLVLGESAKDPGWYYVEYIDEFGTYYGYVHSDYTQRYY